jgi:hypothetical protein
LVTVADWFAGERGALGVSDRGGRGGRGAGRFDGFALLAVEIVAVIV